jgi:hypothetical protein
MPLRMSGDLIGDAIDRLAELAPALDTGIVRALEMELRTAYGGAQIYIQQKRPRPSVTPEHIDPSLPIAAQAEQLGRHRTHLYRLLKRSGGATSRKKQGGGGL